MNEGVQFQLNEIFQNGLENALFPKLGGHGIKLPKTLRNQILEMAGGRKISDFSYFSDVCTS